MYALFFPKTPLYGETAEFTAIFWGDKSSEVKSTNYLADGRNLFTESRFSEQQCEYVEAWRITRFRVKSHRTEKSIGVTCGQDIVAVILSGFDGNGIVHDTAKRMRRMACWLPFFII